MAAYATYNLVVPVVCFAVWYGVAGLILWRNPMDRGALVAAFLLVAIPFLGGASNELPSGPLSSLAGTGAVIAIVLFCLLFPDGRFASRWAALLALAFGAFIVATAIPLPLHPSAVLNLVNLVPILLFVLVVVAQMHRYRTMSSWVQRQQTKVALVGVAAAILGLGLLWLPYGIAPFPTGNGSLYNSLANVSGPETVLTALPVSIGIAMLRNGLWEVDRVINRALVYSLLTATLAALYLGIVIGLQALFRLISGNQSDFAVAVSTLVIAVLFNPLRHRIQDLIARAFYRRRYNAGQVLSVFGATCRDQTDLERLREDLMQVVKDTMHPEHVSLWLRD